MGNMNETKSWFYEKINKIGKYLGKLREKERRQISKIRNEGISWGSSG